MGFINATSSPNPQKYGRELTQRRKQEIVRYDKNQVLNWLIYHNADIIQ